MKITTVLVDLDGTLLPMDNDLFTKGYFKLLAEKLAHHVCRHLNFILFVFIHIILPAVFLYSTAFIL